MNETDLQIRLRRAKEALAYAKEHQNAMRRALAEADSSAKRAKERYEELFLAEQEAARQKMMKEYRHTTY